MLSPETGSAFAKSEGRNEAPAKRERDESDLRKKNGEIASIAMKSFFRSMAQHYISGPWEESRISKRIISNLNSQMSITNDQ